MVLLSIHMLGSKWRPFQKNIIFIIQMCLEKCRKFLKNQGKVREFLQEQNVETMQMAFLGPPSPSQNLGQKAESNHKDDSNEPPITDSQK